METESSNVFKSPTSPDSIQGSSSSKVKVRLSEIRYTPTRNDQEGLSKFILDICQDSLEIPRPKSRLIEFTQLRDGDEKPRQIMMPLFFRAKSSPTHQRQGSLKPILKPKKSNITEILLNLREKPEPKSSLKKSETKKQKTVSFCSQIELSSPDTFQNSVVFIGDDEVFEDSLEKCIGKSGLATMANSILHEPWCKIEKFPETTTSTLQNLEINDETDVAFEPSKKFLYEEEVRISLSNKEVEFNEFSTVAYCKNCEKEIVTAVSFEKVKGESCADVTEWILCWVFPACMYKNKKIVHKCPACACEIAIIDY